MNPDAKVKMRGVQVGTVSSIESRPDGMAVLHLAMDPAQLKRIPSNVQVDIASSTVFGAKFVQLQNPADPSGEPVRAGDVLQGDHVTVEINTVFQQLTQLLDSIDPLKVNETLGAMAAAFNGRGEQFGRTLDRFQQLSGRDRAQPGQHGDTDPAAAPGPDRLCRRRTGSGGPPSTTPPRWATASWRNRTIWTRFSSAQSDWLMSATRCWAATGRRCGILTHILLPTSELLAKYHEGTRMRHRRSGAVLQVTAVRCAGHHHLGQLDPGRGALPLSQGPAEGGRQG